MKLLIDTCIISEFSKHKLRLAVSELIENTDESDIFMSVISFGELIKGVNLLEEGKKKRSLTSWVSGIEKNFKDRILPIDEATAHIWGEVTAQAQRNGKIIPASDGLIAATAIKHGLHLVTSNIAHFTPTGVLVLPI